MPRVTNSTRIFTRVRHGPKIACNTLTPGLHKFRSTVTTKIGRITIFTTTSRTFSRHGVGYSVDRDLRQFIPVVSTTHRRNIDIHNCISYILNYPCRNSITPRRITLITHRLCTVNYCRISLKSAVNANATNTAQQVFRIINTRIPQSGLTNRFRSACNRTVTGICTDLLRNVTIFSDSVTNLNNYPCTGNTDNGITARSILCLLGNLKVRAKISVPRLLITNRRVYSILKQMANSHITGTHDTRWVYTKILPPHAGADGARAA